MGVLLLCVLLSLKVSTPKEGTHTHTTPRSTRGNPAAGSSSAGLRNRFKALRVLSDTRPGRVPPTPKRNAT